MAHWHLPPPRHLVLQALLLAAALVVLLPAVWIALAAFKTQIALLRGDMFFTPFFGNFEELLFSRTADYFKHFGNSLIVASISTLLVLVIATLAADSMARAGWPAWVPAAVMLGSLAFHMVPPITLAGPWYVLLRWLGWDGTHAALVLTHLALNLPLGIGVMSVFVRAVPLELEEAARLDGATTPQVWRYVIVPGVRPGLAATAVLAFVFSWNEFAVSLTLSGPVSATVPVAIAKFAQEYEIKNGVMAAASLLSIVPAMLLLLLAQRHIVKGLTAGSGK